MEEFPHVISISSEDLKREQIKLNTHSRDKSGRFIVTLNFKDVKSVFTVALRCFLNLESRLSQDPYFYEAYKKINVGLS